MSTVSIVKFHLVTIKCLTQDAVKFRSGPNTIVELKKIGHRNINTSTTLLLKTIIN